MLGLEKFNANSYNVLVVVFVALGTLTTAYGFAIIGSTVGQPNFYTYFNLAPQGEPGYAHTTNIIGALNGVNSAGTILGAIISAWFANAYSRKRAIQLGCIIVVIGGALCAGSVDIAMFIVARIVAGVGCGILAIVVPMYQGEVATAETRGAMMCVTGIMYAFGYTTAGWLGFGFYFIPGSSPNAQVAWRFPLAFQCFPPLVVLAGSRFIPYSPRWLMMKDRHEEAYQIVQRLHANPRDPNHIEAKQEYYLMKKQYDLDKQFPSGAFSLFSTKANRRRALVSAIMMWSNQFLGIYVMTNYGVLIYASLGLGGFRPLLLNACWTTFTIIGNIWTALYIDRFGRRIFLLIGATGCTVSLIFLAALTASFLNTSNGAGLSAAVFFVWFYILWWCFFVDATQYVYVSEIWPNHLRAAGTAWGISFFFLASEVTLVAAPVALNKIGWKFYLVLICPSIVYICIIFFLFPETKGRTLEEIGTLFGDEHIASHWYGISEEEKAKIAQEALRETEGDHVANGARLDEKGEPERHEEVSSMKDEK